MLIAHNFCTIWKIQNLLECAVRYANTIDADKLDKSAEEYYSILENAVAQNTQKN